MSRGVLETTFAGGQGRLFSLATRTGLLTVLSAGLYRFWMKTRLRRFFWSSLRPGGIPLEYVGDPLEKLLGFLYAVVILAFYIGVVNLVLMYFSFSLFQTNGVAYGLSFLGVLPILFFARYRARRYVLARTRWRGIRFGLEPGAWGYAWRALVLWLATIASLGILWPLKAFMLERYMTDRTWFGNERFAQGGRWTMLLGAMKHLYIALGASMAIVVAAALTGSPAILSGLLISLPWALWGLAYWRAEAFRRLTSAKTLGEVGLHNTARAGRVFRILSGGYLLAALVTLAGGFTIFFVVGFVMGLLGHKDLLDALVMADGKPADVPLWLVVLWGAATYFAGFLLWSASRQTFVTLPMARHFAETTQLHDSHALARIRQRGRDEFVEAEGFADALDVGAAL